MPIDAYLHNVKIVLKFSTMMGRVRLPISMHGHQIVRLMMDTKFQMKNAQWRFCKGTLDKTSYYLCQAEKH